MKTICVFFSGFIALVLIVFAFGIYRSHQGHTTIPAPSAVGGEQTTMLTTAVNERRDSLQALEMLIKDALAPIPIGTVLSDDKGEVIRIEARTTITFGWEPTRDARTRELADRLPAAIANYIALSKDEQAANRASAKRLTTAHIGLSHVVAIP